MEQAPLLARDYAEVTDQGPMEAARRLLNDGAKRSEEAGGEVAETYLRAGDPAEESIGLAEDIDADLIVAGGRGLSPLKRLFLGSVSGNVVRYAYCSILVVRAEEESEERKVVKG